MTFGALKCLFEMLFYVLNINTMNQAVGSLKVQQNK